MTVHHLADDEAGYSLSGRTTDACGTTLAPTMVDRLVRELVDATREPEPEPDSNYPVTTEPGPHATAQAPGMEAGEDSVAAERRPELSPETLDTPTFQQILGDELRALRRRRGWTRMDLLHHVKIDVSLQTLATYELGTRRISVLRLFDLCQALNELPQDLIARVHRRVAHDCLVADLSTLAGLAEPHLAPLRSWAQQQLRQSGTTTDFRFDLSALQRMAELCSTPLPELIQILHGLRA